MFYFMELAWLSEQKCLLCLLIHLFSWNLNAEICGSVIQKRQAEEREELQLSGTIKAVYLAQTPPKKQGEQSQEPRGGNINQHNT